MLSGWRKTLAVVLLLFASSAASASPTVVSDSPARAVSLSADRAISVVTCNLGSNTVCDRMSELAKAFLQPPLSASADKSDSRTAAGDIRCLPPVPSAVAMVLTGFICISLIRDRRTWLAVLAGLLWVGQTGINALPELTSRIGRKVHNSRLIEPELAASYFYESGFYPANYTNETRYTGLLHHLAGIPRGTSTFKNNCSTLIRHFASGTAKNTRVSRQAIVPVLSYLSSTYNCLVRPTRQFICFTPAFIFNLIPRGPPISKMRIFCKPQGV